MRNQKKKKTHRMKLIETENRVVVPRGCESEVKVKVAQSCPTLCNLMDYTVHGILQARILEWVAFIYSRGSPQSGIKPRSPAL